MHINVELSKPIGTLYIIHKYHSNILIYHIVIHSYIWYGIKVLYNVDYTISTIFMMSR